MPMRACEVERRSTAMLRFIALQAWAIEKKIERRIRAFEQKNGLRFATRFAFIRSWIEKPLSIGAVTPSGKALARTMARYVDPATAGPVVELGPGTGPVTEALVERGIDPARLVLVEFNPTFCRLLRPRYPGGDRGPGRRLHICSRLLDGVLTRAGGGGRVRPAAVHQAAEDAAAAARRGLRADAAGRAVRAVHLHAISPIPRSHGRVRAEASERIWRNLPPARVWVYRRTEPALDMSVADSNLRSQASTAGANVRSRKSWSFPARSAAGRTTCGWPRSRPRN